MSALPARGPPKKLVIKNFKQKSSKPKDLFEPTWAKLKEAVEAIQESRAAGCGLEELFQAVESLCLNQHGEVLYARLKEACQRHVVKRVAVLVAQDQDDAVFLEMVDHAWRQHCSQMLLIRDVFLVLDRTFVKKGTDVRSLWDLGLHLFGEQFVSQQRVRRKTLEGIVGLIEAERNGEAVDRGLLKSLVSMLFDLSLYATEFEPLLLDNSGAFYQAEGSKFLEQLEVADYLVHADKRLAEEIDRVAKYLVTSTRAPLVAVVEQHLLEAHAQTMIDKGFSALVKTDRVEDLARMYSLLGRVGALGALRQAFAAFIKSMGLSIVTDEENDPSMVQSLLTFKAKLTKILDSSFQRDNDFAYTLKESFESFVNARQNKPAELVAKYIDAKLRSGNKSATDEEMEAELDQVMAIFRYIQGKDIFEAFYKKDLAKRLLLGRSASFDQEKSMIAKLKTECGAGFTNKLEGMFKDIDLSKDIMESFKQSTRYKDTCVDADLNVQVLTSAFWPTYPPMEIRAPPQLSLYLEVFKSFYLSKHVGRRLLWQHSLGQCTLKAYFNAGRKELQVSLFQAVTLLLFNDTPQLSFSYIKEHTGIDDLEMRRTLLSLACGKVRVLSKVPKGRDVNDTDEFVFNERFTHPQIRIKINSIQMKETPEEQATTNEKVFQDRQYQVDAAIVRVMKTRKKLSHQLLIVELFNQLKFPCKPADIKKRIESLIDREYLERDETNPQEYHYLA